MAFVWICTFLVAIAAYLFTRKKKYRFPPGPKGIPIFGNLFRLSEYPWETYGNFAEQYGKIARISFFKTSAFLLSDSKIIREAMNDPRFQGRPNVMLLYFLSRGSNGVLLSEGSTWVEQRRFTLRHLRDFGFGKAYMENVIMEQVNDVIEDFKFYGDQAKSIEVHEKFILPVINSLWHVVAGKKFKQDDLDKINIIMDIDKYFGKMSTASTLWFLAPWLLKMFPEMTGFNDCLRAANRLHTMLNEVVEEHQKSLPEDGSPRDFIDAYLHEIQKAEPGSSFYKEEGYKQLMAGIGDLFFAGTETTSTTLAWAVLYLAMHPEVQEKLQKEIDQITGNSRQVSLTDRLSMPFAEATIWEIFRLSSIAPVGVLHKITEDATFHGYDFPKDSWIVLNQYYVQNHPSIWGDPEKFRPERFLSPDGKTLVKNENLIPFSVGKRSCIGESLARDEVFLFTTNIFQRFKVTLDSNRPTPNLKGMPGFIRLPEKFSALFKDRH